LTGVTKVTDTVSVIDYRAGNAPSVGYALARLGIPHRLISRPDEVAAAARLVLPGVGAARATLGSLTDAGLVEPLTRRVVTEGTPFLGICIGLQILFEHSEEDDTPCLGWLPGTVRRFPSTSRVPQIGWNGVAVRQPHPVFDGFPDGGHCYFVNSYFAAPADAVHVLATTEYGAGFCSVAGRDSLVATQFHCEKSGPLGLGILERFARWEP